jgi:hypothetical protein
MHTESPCIDEYLLLAAGLLDIREYCIRSWGKRFPTATGPAW